MLPLLRLARLVSSVAGPPVAVPARRTLVRSSSLPSTLRSADPMPAQVRASALPLLNPRQFGGPPSIPASPRPLRERKESQPARHRHA